VALPLDVLDAIEFLPEALAEADEAIGWYYARNPAAAADFEAELEHACWQIIEAPYPWPPYRHQTRRFLLHRFPYEVVYREQAPKTLIVAVAHCRRRPGYWKTR
jgi:plasmid stabilization system protein ParE